MRLAPSTLRRAALMAAACGSILVASPLSLRADPRPTVSSEAEETAPAKGESAGEEKERVPAPPEQLRRIKEVTVTATRAERDVLEVPGNVTVIDREEIEESGARNVPDLLRRESGLFVINDTSHPGGYRVAPRGFLNGGGFGGTNLLVLVDGRRVNEPDTSTVDWALIPLENVERIEVIRGPASAVYGDNAVGGVIQIVTRRPEGPLSAEISGRTGTYDTDGGSLSVTGEEGPVGFSLFARGFSTDSFREKADFRDRKLRGKLRFDLSQELSATVSGGYSADDRDLPGDLTQSEIDMLGRDAAEPRFFPEFADTRTGHGQLQLDWTPTETSRGELLAYHRKESTTSQLSADPMFGGPFGVDTETDATGLNAEFEDQHELFGFQTRQLVGVDLLREDLERSGDLGPRRTRRVVGGVFVQGEVALTERLRLSAGVRYDDADYDLEQGMPESSVHRQLGEWSPKAGLVYRIADPVSVYASYAKGTRFPNIDEVAGVLFASPELDPQRSDSYELGLKVRTRAVEANFALYHMAVEDEIYFDPALGGGFGQSVNLGRVQHRGVESSVRVRPMDWLEFYASYTFDDTTVEEAARSGLEGERAPLTPEHRGSAGFVLHLPYAFEVTLNGNFVGSRSVANDVEHGLEELPKYARYDAQVSYQPELREHLTLELWAGVRNLFDREYAEFAAAPSPGVPPIGLYPAPGRHYELGATLRWR